MEQLISGGRIADVILVALAVEVAVIGYFLWRRQETVALLSLVAGTLAGGALVLALKAALTQASGLFVATYLLAALLAHAADIALRLRSIRGSGSLPSSGTPPLS